MLNVFKKISKLIYWHKNINQLTWVIVGLLIIRSVGAIESGEGDPFQVGMEQLGKVCQNDLSPKYYLDYLEEGQTVLKKADSQDRVNTEQLYQICCSYLKLIGLTHLDPSVCRQMWVWLNEWLTRLASSRPSQDQIYVLGRKLIKAATERRLEQLTCQEILAKSRLWAHQMMNKNSHPIADQAYQIGKDYLKACRKYQECCFNEAYQIALSESETWLEAADRWAGVNPEIAYGDELTYPWTKKRQSDYSPQVIKDWLTKAHNNHDYTYWLGIYHLENQPSSAQYWLKKSLKSRDRVAAAYHLGMLYALTIPYNSHHKITAHKWFVRAEQWDQKDLRTCLALRKMWHTKAMTNPAYAYVLTWLSQMPDIHKLIPEDFASWDQISKIAKEYNGALSESLGHISEFVKKKPLKCVVIGGGYTGILSAVQLARLKDINDKPLFKVTLLEQNSTLLNGASMVAGRLHLGGEYPLDTLTALDCLYAGLLFWQMIPQGYTKIPGVTYLIDKKSEEQPQSISDSRFLNRAKMIEEYRKIQARYEIYYHHLKKDDRYLNNSFFGEPKNLLQIVEPHDEVTKGFAGGIETRERGINPALMGAFLEEQLKISGVKVRFFEKVIEAVPEIYGYKLKTHLNHYQADIVVNATWDQAPSLDLEVLEAQDRDHYPDKLLVHLRGIGIVDLSQCELPKTQQGELTAHFGLLGEGGGMISPFNQQIGLVYWPSAEGSHLQTFLLTKNDLLGWQQINDYTNKHLNEAEKAKKLDVILNNLRDKYPYLADAKPLKLFVRPTLTYTDELEQRPQDIVKGWGDHGLWIKALSMKATFAPLTALQVVHLALNRAYNCGVGEKEWSMDVCKAKHWLEIMERCLCEEGRIPSIDEPEGINLPPQFCLSPMSKDHLYLQAMGWAYQHGFPSTIVSE